MSEEREYGGKEVGRWLGGGGGGGGRREVGDCAEMNPSQPTVQSDPGFYGASSHAAATSSSSSGSGIERPSGAARQRRNKRRDERVPEARKLEGRSPRAKEAPAISIHVSPHLLLPVAPHVLGVRL